MAFAFAFAFNSSETFTFAFKCVDMHLLTSQDPTGTPACVCLYLFNWEMNFYKPFTCDYCVDIVDF